MLSKVLSASLLGIDALPVEVEVDIATRGLPHFTVVGLPDAAVKESRERVRAALKNIGFSFPLRPITVNLAPADLKKEGSAFDLPMAVGLIASEGALPAGAATGYLLTGELSLNGLIKPVKGALSMALLAREMGLKLIVPAANAEEAAVVRGAEVYGASSLPEVVGFLRAERQIQRAEAPDYTDISIYDVDFSEVKGQEHAKRAMEVAAAGGHNIIMIGPPGAGKTMLSRRLPTIMPPITLEEAIETTRVYSVAGMLREGRAIVNTRPFRSPHHTISDAALIGGGQSPRPGEVSLANNGVLFLDELPEFKRSVLEVMRQPLEDMEVTVSRAAASITYPSRFMLVAAMNPCPCGYIGDPRHSCSCSAGQIHRYRTRLSGPLLDRIDIHIEVPSVPYKDIASDAQGEGSGDIRTRVLNARAVQRERLGADRLSCNGHMRTRHLKKHCRLGEDSQRLLESAMKRLGLSARAYSRILKISRTIADLEGARDIQLHHVSEAIQYRTLDRKEIAAF